MKEDAPTDLDQFAAWSQIVEAGAGVFVAALAIAAFLLAKKTLDAATAANLQAQRDSIEQTRPNVFVEIAPGLAGISHYDIVVTNVGNSSARELTLTFNAAWPDPLDDVATSVKNLFDTPRTLPPTCRIRSMWRLQGNFDDGTKKAGMGTAGTITANYRSDDPAAPWYSEEFDIHIESSGFWPVGEAGEKPNDAMSGDVRQFYVLGQALVRRVAELTR